MLFLAIIEIKHTDRNEAHYFINLLDGIFC